MNPVRVVLATAVREWRIIVRYPLAMAGVVLWPLLFGFGLVFTARALAGPEGAAAGFLRSAGTADYATFLALGTATWMVLNWLLWGFGLSLRSEQWRGTLEAVWVTPASRWLVVLGYGVASFVESLLDFGATLLVFRLMLGASWPTNLAGVLAVFLAAVPALYGFGLLFASLVLWAKEAVAATYFVRGVFTICAGLTYPLSVLPGWMRTIAWWLPVTHAMEGIRQAGLYGAAPAELAPILSRLLLFGVVLVPLGHLAFTWTERRMRILGTAGTF
jgi:ABC-2 type transport system permease protein